MADLLNIDLDITEQINHLKNTDIRYAISLGTTNTKINNLQSTYDTNFIHVAASLQRHKYNISVLSDVVDTNYTTQGLLTNGNYSTLTNYCNTLNSKTTDNYNDKAIHPAWHHSVS